MMKNRKHILVIDDVTTNLRCLGEVLKDFYSVSMVKSGAQALKLMKKTKPDLVLLDVKMPEMDGYETFSHMKEDEELSSVPVIFLTADKADESEIKGRKMGAADYIKKPFEPVEMLKRIEYILENYNSFAPSVIELDVFVETIENISKKDGSGALLLLDLSNILGLKDENGNISNNNVYDRFLDCLSSFIHRDDFVSINSDEKMLVFLKDAVNVDKLYPRVVNLIDNIDGKLSVVKKDNSLSSVAVGVSIMPYDGKSFAKLFNNANLALSFSRKENGSKPHFFNPNEIY